MPEEPEIVPPITITHLTWQGNIPTQKWVYLYMKVLTKFASHHDFNLTFQEENSGDAGISEQKLEEMMATLRDLGLHDVMTIG